MKTALDPEREKVLIESVKQGDRNAFDEIVRAYRQVLFNYALSILHNEEEAKDASQEAFIRAFYSIKQFQGSSQFSTWLFQILINHCRDVIRKKTRRRAVVSDFQASADQDEDETQNLIESHADTSVRSKPDETAFAGELRDLLNSATEKLPPKQKEIFILRFQQGLKLEEIAKIVKSPEGTVKSNLFKAIQNMRTILGGLKVECSL